MILISQRSCAHHPLNHLHHAFTVHPQSYVCYSIINFSAWNSYITWKNIVASSTNPETRDVKSGCWSVAEELNREFKSTLFQYKQKSESRNEPRDAQLLVLVWRTVLKWLFFKLPPMRSQFKNDTPTQQTWLYCQSSYKPFDWLWLHECSICHHFHPRFHLFGCVCAKVVRPHVGMCRLFWQYTGSRTGRVIHTVTWKREDKNWLTRIFKVSSQ